MRRSPIPAGDPSAFWANTERTPSGCWLWKGKPRGRGYGRIGIKGKAYGAHQYAWILTHGAIPDDLLVCHTCDTPACVNPDHLFLGTGGDNMRDMAAKGRSTVGERHPSVKLTEEQVIEIRRRAAAGEFQNALAQEHGVTISTVNLIVKGKKWKHILPAGELATPVPPMVGERTNSAKLTDEIVRLARREHSAGVAIDELATRFGVCRDAMKNALQRKTWKHVE